MTQWENMCKYVFPEGVCPHIYAHTTCKNPCSSCTELTFKRTWMETRCSLFHFVNRWPIPPPMYVIGLLPSSPFSSFSLPLSLHSCDEGSCNYYPVSTFQKSHQCLIEHLSNYMGGIVGYILNEMILSKIASNNHAVNVKPAKFERFTLGAPAALFN